MVSFSACQSYLNGLFLFYKRKLFSSYFKLGLIEMENHFMTYLRHFTTSGLLSRPSFVTLVN